MLHGRCKQKCNEHTSGGTLHQRKAGPNSDVFFSWFPSEQTSNLSVLSPFLLEFAVAYSYVQKANLCNLFTRQRSAKNMHPSRCWWQLCRAFNCRILYDHYPPTVILIVILIIGIPSPTHSFTLGLNPSFSANPTYRVPHLSFFSFRFHYMDFPDCLLLLLSTSVYLLFSFFCFYTFLVVSSVR